MDNSRRPTLVCLTEETWECEEYLISHRPWLSEKWCGPKDTYRPWRVYRSVKSLERKVLENAFFELSPATEWVRSQVGEVRRPRGRPRKDP
jgi:hypothetical protein